MFLHELIKLPRDFLKLYTSKYARSQQQYRTTCLANVGRCSNLVVRFGM